MTKEEFIAQYVLAVTRANYVYSDRQTGNRFTTLSSLAAAKVEDAVTNWDAIQKALLPTAAEKAEEEELEEALKSPPSRR